MAWAETKEDFLRMMKVNHKIFGKEILKINDAEEDLLINYFEQKLSNILYDEVFINSGYAWCDCNGWSGINDYGLKKSFGLNIHKCIKIFEYIYGRVYLNRYGNGVQLHWTDSVVVINYIKDGYKLSESGYEFIRSTDGHTHCHKYN